MNWIKGTPTKRPSTKRPATKRPATKHPFSKTSSPTKPQAYKISMYTKRPRLQNVHVYKTSLPTKGPCNTLGFYKHFYFH
jgi:hypothetical protein